MQNKEYLIQKYFLFMWKCRYKCNHHSFIWCSSIIAECVTFVSVYLFNHLGQRNKKYQRYVYLFCFSPQQKVEEIETFTLIKEKGIPWDWGNLVWEELKLNEVRKEREKEKNTIYWRKHECNFWACVVSLLLNVRTFFSTIVMLCYETIDNDGEWEPQWRQINKL